MNPLTYQQKVLELAVEDLYGLWEMLWGLRGIFPDSTDSKLWLAAESAVRELVAKGWIRVFRRSGATGEAIPLQPDEVNSALSDQKNWDEPTIDSVQIVIGATAEGERAYYGLSDLETYEKG